MATKQDNPTRRAESFIERVGREEAKRQSLRQPNHRFYHLVLAILHSTDPATIAACEVERQAILAARQ